jgi:flagellar hook-length control protein FliK
VNANSAATDAKATAPAALLTKGKKVAGKGGLAEALLPRSRKGVVSFARIMSGKISAAPGEKAGGKSLGLSLTTAGAGLKNAAHAVMAFPKAASLKLPSGLLAVLDESEKLAPGKDEKSDGRKKTARLIVHQALVTAEAGTDKSKAAESTAAAEKRIAAPAAPAQNAARPAAAPQIVPVHIVDLRKRTAEKSSDGGSQKIAQTAPAAKETGTLFVPQGVKDIDAPRKTAPAPSAAPQSGLERLRETAGSELIRASQLVLRDGGGEIRLVLKPESLGSVRIRMNLVDNKIEGRIIVDTSAVKQVMDQNIDALSRALTAGGFQTASLEVSVGGQNADNGRQMQEPPDEVRRVAAQGFERNVPEESLSMGDLLVNLFV